MNKFEEKSEESLQSAVDGLIFVQGVKHIIRIQFNALCDALIDTLNSKSADYYLAGKSRQEIVQMCIDLIRDCKYKVEGLDDAGKDERPNSD